MTHTLGGYAYKVKALMPRFLHHAVCTMMPVADTIVSNLIALKADRGITSDNALAKLAGLDQKSIWRILHKEQSPTIDTLEKLARPFGLHAWQLLMPRLDPKNPPVFVMTDDEQNLYRKLAAMATELVAHEPIKKFQ